MILTDLVEYKPDQRRIIELAERLGIDTSILNPDYSDDAFKEVYRLAKFNIKVQPEFVKGLNYYVTSMLLCNGYTLQTERTLRTKAFEFTFEDLIVLDRLGVDLETTTYDQFPVEVTYKIRTGKHPSNIEIPEDILKLFAEKSWTLNDREKILIGYAMETGKIYLLESDGDIDYKKNRALLRFINFDIDNIEELAKESTYQLLRMLVEYQNTGRVDIMTDTNYSYDDRLNILNLYIETGIDLRYTQNKEILKEFNNEVNRSIFTRIVEIFEEHFTNEELKELREMSNKFRQDRLEKEFGIVL